ncbi:MAG: N-acetyl-gamma-glutamyl-phosphate reductase [Zetaproteobacteria bacterium]|nr:N-acetyl-gamma-glutamyl-phosphate reductase [Zetaproteobacteria bacterium]
MNRTPVAILGATGYTGAELIRLLDQHPHFEIAYLGAHSQQGKRAGEVITSIGNPAIANMILQASDTPIPDSIPLIFTALPHGASANIIASLINNGKRVIDLSADFRHQSSQTYLEAYQAEHPCPELFPLAIYGLSELQRDRIKNCQLLANPGCYPTSLLLPLIPLLQKRLIDPNYIIVDSKSGTSGAGRSAKTNLLYCEINEGMSAYGLPRHRHNWEMEEWAQCLGGLTANIHFVPHIIPMTRGMMSTIHLQGGHAQAWHETLCATYQNEPFIQILPYGELPSTHHVRGSNRCSIGMIATGENCGVIVSCIDNLLKGASGQAIQNANIMFGFEETTGLSSYATWP